jgi:uncharacterized membrane protein
MMSMSTIIHLYQGESLPPENPGAPEGQSPVAGLRPAPPAPARVGRGLWERLIARFPWLRRQLHPLIIHFPITFFLGATFFSLLYLLTRVQSFQDTARHCLGGGVLFMIPAIFTGLFTEKANFPEPPPAARLERILSFILLAAAAAALIWNLACPDILDHLHGWNLIYLLLILALTPLVSVIGYFGGMITFPLKWSNTPPSVHE